MTVLANLQKLYGGTYTEQNLLLSGTHTHSAPGGFMMDLLYDISTLGFLQETFDAYVDGITMSVRRAHENTRRGRIFINMGEVEGANINRSPTAYENNPETERRKYASNVDKTLVQLRFDSTEGQPLGALHWFAVHPTSMNNTNVFISSDNVGLASLLFEQRVDPGSLPGKVTHVASCHFAEERGCGSFVAGFASSNLGDVSPNTRGPRCEKSGLECDVSSSTCSRDERCFSSGPGEDMVSSTRIIAEKLLDKALELFNDRESSHEIKGPVRVIHQYVDMPQAVASVYDPQTRTFKKVSGCLPAMGYSFAAGTTDGPGAFTFKQATKTTNPFWNVVRNFLAAPKLEDEECQGSKPILLETGRLKFPYSWQPSIVSTQLAVLGDVAIACVPGEFTTMAGRRLRDAVSGAFAQKGRGKVHHVVVAGLCNTYSSYITTKEEYDVQRYEGASTIFGPHTLQIYLQQYERLAEAIAIGSPVDPGPDPPIFTKRLLSFITPVIFDSPKFRYGYGDVLLQPPREVTPGDKVMARFVSGHPRNNPRHGDTFLSVEKWTSNGTWAVVATDANWETRFEWIRTHKTLGTSEAVITWQIPPDVVPGDYRIGHFGDYKYIFGGVYPYSGFTRTFKASRGPAGASSRGSTPSGGYRGKREEGEVVEPASGYRSNTSKS
uniref:Neutral ceramidase n=1 Tax=Timema shepardi TaxID=629360 RepID=A0A7R9B5R0_TIMSH|nr:unnamed protein product [Timema shepardi]